MAIYERYEINGFRFCTMQRDSERVTQNNKIFVKKIVGIVDMDYYEVLIDIVEL